MIIDRDSNPKDTVYYTAGCILEVLKNEESAVDKLFQILQQRFNESLDYTTYLLALDFLYLIQKIDITERGLLICI